MNGQLLGEAYRTIRLSSRDYDRILKMSCTIVNLAVSDEIKPEFLAEAIHYGSLERGGWIG